MISCFLLCFLKNIFFLFDSIIPRFFFFSWYFLLQTCFTFKLLYVPRHFFFFLATNLSSIEKHRPLKCDVEYHIVGCLNTFNRNSLATYENCWQRITIGFFWFFETLGEELIFRPSPFLGLQREFIQIFCLLRCK